MLNCDNENGYEFFQPSSPFGIYPDLQFEFRIPEGQASTDYSRLFLIYEVPGPDTLICNTGLGGMICLKKEGNVLKKVTPRTNTSITLTVDTNVSGSYLELKTKIIGVENKYCIIGIDDIRGYKKAEPFFALDLSYGVNIGYSNNKLYFEGGLPT